MHSLWLPTESTAQLLVAKQVQEQFIKDQADEFRGYWLTIEKTYTEDQWSNKFYDRCIKVWKKDGHLYKSNMNSSEAIKERLKDTSWGMGLA